MRKRPTAAAAAGDHRQLTDPLQWNSLEVVTSR